MFRILTVRVSRNERTGSKCTTNNRVGDSAIAPGGGEGKKDAKHVTGKGLPEFGYKNGC